MRALTLLPLLCLPAAFAAPGHDHDAQVAFGQSAALADASQHVVQPVAHNCENALQEDKLETWSEEGREFVKQNGLVCTSFVALKSLSAQPVTF